MTEKTDAGEPMSAALPGSGSILHVCITRGSNTRLRVDAADFEDLDVASIERNRNEIPAGLNVNKDYLEGYLSARYSEQVDFDPDSPANQWRAAMGLNKQGKIQSSATMFANKYPWKDALNLFGNLNGLGAQMPR